MADAKLLIQFLHQLMFGHGAGGICTNLSMIIMMLRIYLFHLFLFIFSLQTVHKKTFYYLEQLILKHKLHQNALNIKEIHGRSMAYGLI